MARFKVGDRVRVREPEVTWPLSLGTTYMVREVTGRPIGEFVQLDGVTHPFSRSGWSAGRFELAPEKPNRKVYLAGPITGVVDNNFPAFNAAADTLRSAGLDVFNPADHGAGGDWADTETPRTIRGITRQIFRIVVAAIIINLL